MDYFAMYRKLLTGDDTPPLPADLTAEQHLEWEAYLHKAGEAFLALREELAEVETFVKNSLGLPPHLKDWGTQQLIDFLSFVQGQWYERIFVQGLLQQQNAAATLDVLEGRLG